MEEIGVPVDEWRVSEGKIAGQAVIVDRRPVWGLPAVTLWVLDSDAEEMARALFAGNRELRPVGFEALNTARVEGRFPLFGQDYGEANLPQETGLDGLGVSYSKGCYLGQEVIARLHHRGSAQRSLVGLELPEENAGVPEGSDMTLDGRHVGRVTSSVSSWSRGGNIGLAIVHRRAAVPGTRLELVTGGEAVVASAPRPL